MLLKCWFHRNRKWNSTTPSGRTGNDRDIEVRSDPEGDNEVQNTAFTTANGQINGAYAMETTGNPKLTSDVIRDSPVHGRSSMRGNDDSHVATLCDTEPQSGPSNYIRVVADVQTECRPTVNAPPFKPPRNRRAHEEDLNVVTQDRPRTNAEEIVM